MRSLSTLLLLLTLPAAAFAQPVNVILQDSRVVSGDLLGSNARTVFVMENGRAREISRSEIKAVFDAKTSEPVPLNTSANPPAATPALEYEVRTQPGARPADASAPLPAAVELRHQYFLLDIGFDMALGPDNPQVTQLWTQLVPSQCNRDLNRFFMGVDLDFMVRPFDWWAIGPFFNWMFMAPGLNSTLVYNGGGYWVYYGGTWYYYDYGHKEVDYSLDFNNITYGAVTRFDILSEPNANVYVQLAAGYLDLAGGYEVRVNGTRKQRVDFLGSSPYWRLTAGIDAGDSTGRFGVQIGYQSALVKDVTAKIIQNDYYRDEENTTWQVLDSRDGSHVKVNYSGPIIACYASLYF